MYRRRWKKREIDFGFDSFLDLVANVIGVVIRFILVAWVGARSYNALMTADLTSPIPEMPALREDEHPLWQQSLALRNDITDMKARLLDHVAQLELERRQTESAAIAATHVAFRTQDLQSQRVQINTAIRSQSKTNELQAASMDDLRTRSEALKRQIAELDKLPRTKELRYRVPVSKPVLTEEIMFECQGGRIAFIDLDAFMRMLRRNIDEKVSIALRSNWQVMETTPPLGDFRMRYTIARRRGMLDSLGSGPPAEGASFSYGLARWEIEPLAAQRGETLQEAVRPGSSFRTVVDGVLAANTVVTIWVYPDSFETFRQVRELLYERGIEVAGRPLPFGVPIAASQDGSASRAQ